MWKDWVMNLQKFWNLTASSPQLTVLTERYGTLWMRRRPQLFIRMHWKNCSSSYTEETGRKFVLRIKERNKEVDSFTAGTHTRASRARESSVTHIHYRPCRGTEHACHRLGQGKSGRQRGTATDQMNKKDTLDQKDTDVHESGCRILPTQPHMGPSDFQVTCCIEL